MTEQFLHLDEVAADFISGKKELRQMAKFFFCRIKLLRC